MVSNRKNVILILLGLGIFLGVYFFLHIPFQNEANMLQTELRNKQSELEILETYSTNSVFYEQEIALAKEYISSQLPYYPADILEEDYLVWLLAQEAATGLQMETVTLQEDELLNQFDLMINLDTEPTSTSVEVYNVSAQIVSMMTYAQLKATLAYIYNDAHRTYLDNLSLNYDASTATLSTTINLAKIIMQYPENVYQPFAMPNLPIGQPNLFGTVEPPPAAPAVEEITP